MMNEPVDGSNKDAAKQCSQSPQTASNKERLAAKMPPKHLGVVEDGQCKANMDDGCENPQGKYPHNSSTRDEVIGKGIEGEVHWKVLRATPQAQRPRSRRRPCQVGGKAAVEASAVIHGRVRPFTCRSRPEPECHRRLSFGCRAARFAKSIPFGRAPPLDSLRQV